MLGWNLKPRAPRSIQLARLPHGQLALVRVDARERDQHVGVGSRAGCSDLVVAEPPPPHPGLVVDGEDHRRHPALAVVVGDLLRARLRRVSRRSTCAAASSTSAVTGSCGSPSLRSAWVCTSMATSVARRSRQIQLRQRAPRTAPHCEARHGCRRSRPRVQPPSRNAYAISAGCEYSESRSPPMPIACPVTPADASDARNTTSGAQSSGMPSACSWRTCAAAARLARRARPAARRPGSSRSSPSTPSGRSR